MKFGELIKKYRNDKGLTQRQLSDQVGCSDSYIGQLEAGNRIPSSDIRMILAQVFELNEQQSKEFHEAAERDEKERADKRISTRSAMISKSMISKPHRLRTLSKSPNDISIEEIVRDMEENPYMREAYADLRKALSKEELREAVLNSLKSFAKIAETEEG